MYKKVVIVGLMVMMLIIAIFTWRLALLMAPFITYYTISRKPWLGEARTQPVNRNHRLPLSRVRIPRMRIK